MDVPINLVSPEEYFGVVAQGASRESLGEALILKGTSTTHQHCNQAMDKWVPFSFKTESASRHSGYYTCRECGHKMEF